MLVKILKRCGKMLIAHERLMLTRGFGLDGQAPPYLPVSGAPIDLLGPIALLGGMASLAIGLLRRKSR
jgi:hypothetical protein